MKYMNTQLMHSHIIEKLNIPHTAGKMILKKNAIAVMGSQSILNSIISNCCTDKVQDSRLTVCGNLIPWERLHQPRPFIRSTGRIPLNLMVWPCLSLHTYTYTSMGSTVSAWSTWWSSAEKNGRAQEKKGREEVEQRGSTLWEEKPS